METSTKNRIALRRLDMPLRGTSPAGEAVKRLPAEIRQSYPDVQWRQMAATRDVVVHDYSGLDVA